MSLTQIASVRGTWTSFVFLSFFFAQNWGNKMSIPKVLYPCSMTWTRTNAPSTPQRELRYLGWL